MIENYLRIPNIGEQHKSVGEPIIPGHPMYPKPLLIFKCSRTFFLPLSIVWPFALTIALEGQLFNSIIKIQELGFGLTVQLVCRTANRLAEHGGKQSFWVVMISK
ncbi:hypothetical protein HHI36_013033 [Cryptolaemus montrouzieri]|uniref:Uncharacterized protein n=1 Tax=Cryptolaemus montrouzieri TaxID=559131 RepID=A0ABD2NGA2_9CUCU